jgi:hypothetical protein
LVESREEIRFGNKGNVSTLGAFNGLMDDIALFDEALSAADIESIYTDGVEAFLANQKIPGDANGDRKVNEIDAQVLATNWGESSATWDMGDFNEDGAVNVKDAAILAANWGYGVSPEEATAVPEPATFLMILSGLAGMAWLRRTRV